MIVFGGWVDIPAPQYFNDVWLLENANGLVGTPSWIELNPTTSLPSRRELHAAAYHGSSKRMIIFGGSGSPTEMLNDTWILKTAAGP
jgi:hypothetical protein